MQRFAGALAAHRAQQSHGFGKSVLFAVEAGDETPTAHFTARFQRAQHAHEIAPGQWLLFASHGLAEDDSGALEQLAGDELGGRRFERVVA